jgi:hypothetical protein
MKTVVAFFESIRIAVRGDPVGHPLQKCHFIFTMDSSYLIGTSLLPKNKNTNDHS